MKVKKPKDGEYQISIEWSDDDAAYVYVLERWSSVWGGHWHEIAQGDVKWAIATADHYKLVVPLLENNQ